MATSWPQTTCCILPFSSSAPPRSATTKKVRHLVFFLLFVSLAQTTPAQPAGGTSPSVGLLVRMKAKEAEVSLDLNAGFTLPSNIEELGGDITILAPRAASAPPAVANSSGTSAAFIDPSPPSHRDAVPRHNTLANRAVDARSAPLIVESSRTLTHGAARDAAPRPVTALANDGEGGRHLPPTSIARDSSRDARLTAPPPTPSTIVHTPGGEAAHRAAPARAPPASHAHTHAGVSVGHTAGSAVPGIDVSDRADTSGTTSNNPIVRPTVRSPPLPPTATSSSDTAAPDDATVGSLTTGAVTSAQHAPQLRISHRGGDGTATGAAGSTRAPWSVGGGGGTSSSSAQPLAGHCRSESVPFTAHTRATAPGAVHDAPSHTGVAVARRERTTTAERGTREPMIGPSDALGTVASTRGGGAAVTAGRIPLRASLVAPQPPPASLLPSAPTAPTLATRIGDGEQLHPPHQPTAVAPHPPGARVGASTIARRPPTPRASARPTMLAHRLPEGTVRSSAVERDSSDGVTSASTIAQITSRTTTTPAAAGAHDGSDRNAESIILPTRPADASALRMLGAQPVRTPARMRVANPAFSAVRTGVPPGELSGSTAMAYYAAGSSTRMEHDWAMANPAQRASLGTLSIPLASAAAPAVRRPEHCNNPQAGRQHPPPAAQPPQPSHADTAPAIESARLSGAASRAFSAPDARTHRTEGLLAHSEGPAASIVLARGFQSGDGSDASSIVPRTPVASRSGMRLATRTTAADRPLRLGHSHAHDGAHDRTRAAAASHGAPRSTTRAGDIGFVVAPSRTIAPASAKSHGGTRLRDDRAPLAESRRGLGAMPDGIGRADEVDRWVIHAPQAHGTLSTPRAWSN